jgi:hypothetical protein
VQTVEPTLAGWPTPTEADSIGSARHGYSNDGMDRAAKNQRKETLTGHPGTTLTDAARLAGWATPKAEDAESTGFSAKRLESGKTPDNLHSQTKLLAGWPTPRAQSQRGASETETREGGADLQTVAGWATPASRDYRTPNHQTYEDRGGGPKGEQLNNQVAHCIPGASLSGSHAATGSLGLLNPAFSLWLIGAPATWLSCAPSATRSTSGSRNKSSARGTQ